MRPRSALQLSTLAALAGCLAACGPLSGGNDGGVGGGSGGGTGGGGGAQGLTASIHRASGAPEPVAIIESLSTNAGGSVMYSAPDAGSSTWYLDLAPASFALSEAASGMTTEATFVSTRTANSLTFTIHAASSAPDNASAGAVVGFVDLRPCFTKAGSTMTTFTFTCASATDPAGTGTSSNSVRVGTPADYCNYGVLTSSGGSIPLAPDMRTGSITVDADSDGMGCLSGVDVQVVSQAGSVTGFAGTSLVNTVITLSATAQ